MARIGEDEIELLKKESYRVMRSGLGNGSAALAAYVPSYLISAIESGIRVNLVACLWWATAGEVAELAPHLMERE